MYLVGEKSSSTSSIDDNNQAGPQNSSSETVTPNHKSRWSKKRKRNSKPSSLSLNGSDESVCENPDHESFSRKASPIPWTCDLHKEFVKAVFEIGIEESSPAVIGEQMITKNNYNIALPKDDEDSAKSLLPKHNPVAMAAALASMDDTKQKPAVENLPEEAEYYKRELTGERLKSHLQKMRKQRGREKEAFLGDYHRFLTKKQILEREQKQVEKLKEQRKEEARRRKRKRPPTRLDAFSFGHSVKFDNEDVTKEEEERLLSMYLPLRSAVAEGEDFDSELEVDETCTLSPFPAGGKAIGMLTWAVREQEAANRKKRKQKQRQLELQQQPQKHRIAPHHHHSHRPPTPCPHGWETASVDSWTSHTAIAAGKLATALAPRRRGPKESHEKGPLIIDCASSEDNHTDDESDSEDELDQFRASVSSLTKSEQNSPLGVSLRLTWDMIRHMHGVIVEDRASKIKEKQLKQKIRALRQQQKQQQQQQQQQNNPKKTQKSFEESSSENEEFPKSSKILPLTKKHPSPEPKIGGSETEQIMLPPMTTTQMSNANYHGFHGAAASALIHHRVWHPSSNTHFLAAMAANGSPPGHLVEALRGAVFDDKPSLLGAFLGNAPPVVSPQSQTPPEGFAEPEKQWNPSSILLKPLVPPKDPLIGLQNPLSFLPESRSDSPLVSLSIPTTPAEAMFRSLLQHNQQPKEQHYPV
eukprot:CAMPEP_0116090134 /NCGR_PEP_ID=MMETSP0327-20121206/6793_1 /TAXON_ID=44447 /ORGANISM="Pseudo-nitzschia delicatissima, Strain B596" /LENGTH=697 /DNA_ID=CAMNT_0003581365 /DNA_START=245 /DNA_END=2338 /DNA_ORIENTATION=+